MRRPHAVPARPRPDRPLEAVPAAEGEDAGLHRPGRRPLPDAHDPHARDDGDLARRRAGAAAQRGSDGGDRARARHGPHAVRSRRRGRARRGCCGSGSAAGSGTTSSRCGSPGRSTSRTRCATASSRTRASASPRRSRGRSSGSSTASRTSTTTSTTRCATGSCREDDLPREEIAVLGATGSARIDTLVHDIVESSEGVDDIRQSAEVGEAMLSLRAFMFERVYLGPQAAPEHEKAHEVITAIFDAPRRAWRRRRRDRRLHRRDDRPLRARLRRVALSARRARSRLARRRSAAPTER